MKRYVETSFFPYGTQYYRAPTPLPEEWAEDLREIARCHYTHVQFRPQWRWHERIRGKYCWDDLDRLCDLAHRNGLRVIIKSMLETAPDWVFNELDGFRIGFHHRPIEPISHAAFYVGGWLPCFDNPQVRQAAFEFNRHLAERYKDHPALWFFNAWNEPRSRPLGECHCSHSVASYRKWLTIEPAVCSGFDFHDDMQALTTRPDHRLDRQMQVFDFCPLLLFRELVRLNQSVSETCHIGIAGSRASDLSSDRVH